MGCRISGNVGSLVMKSEEQIIAMLAHARKLQSLYPSTVYEVQIGLLEYILQPPERPSEFEPGGIEVKPHGTNRS